MTMLRHERRCGHTYEIGSDYCPFCHIEALQDNIMQLRRKVRRLEIYGTDAPLQGQIHIVYQADGYSDVDEYGHPVG